LPVYITSDFLNVSEGSYPLATERGRESFAALEPDARANRAVWSLVKHMWRVPRLGRDNRMAKPAANVMLELPVAGDEDNSENYPLVAWHYAGTGKVMFVGTDQLWRLRFKLGDHYHARFWGQAIQFLTLSRLLGENKRIRLETDRVKVRAGERVQIHANVLSETYDPVKATSYTIRADRVSLKAGATATAPAKASVIEPDTVELKAVPKVAGLFEGAFTPKREGTYRLTAGGKDSRYSNFVDIVVAESNLEQQEPALQAALLRKMAKRSGGQLLSVRQLPALPGLLEGKERTIIRRDEQNLWDYWPTYALLIACVAVEWFLRRRYHLV